ncbi:thiamine pyrophosphate-binding protein [Lentzea flava]|uniref:Acetolactate synthase I/II/III large subunit n=1 Tax=Lentzea flava TaxID=103732 RepID=A0ABQ2UIZ4_9PSEU|nr:thiamine pyrophosphate-binding protein [Lentzea flava]MCP2199438.1 acetolactate synthase-1/2/3 large subunit [Lentzea flava]GGU35158.1 acetolactate synthase I/II/III large subunit [Lentzea flava]
MPKGAESLLEVLAAHEVEVVFGLPGVHNLAIWEALEKHKGIRMIGVRHEQTAVYAADGYARATGKLGVAVVTTGPGAANTLGATGEAWASGSPVLVIATDIPSTLRQPGVYRGVLHETRDQKAMFGPVTKAAFDVPSAPELGACTDKAVQAATRSPHGPVYLGVPTDFLSAEVPHHTPAKVEQPHLVPDLTEALGLIASAERPLIWAGGGAARSGAGAAVGALADKLGAPIVTTYGARGLTDSRYVVKGPVHAPPVGRMWDEADLVIAIGTDFDGMMTQNWLQPRPPALLAINIDKAEANKNYPADVTMEGDAAAVTAALAAGVTGKEAVVDVEAVNAEVRALAEADSPEAVRLLQALEGETATIVADMCIPGYWIGGFHHVTRPRGLAYPVGWGTLGFGFPAAIGAAVQGRTIAVVGDGGFLFACGDLATLRQENLPLTIVLVDDGGYGMLRYDQQIAGHAISGVDLTRPDFAKLAESFGVPAVTLDGFDGLKEALASAVGPTMIVVNASLRPPVNTSPRWYRKTAT